MRKKLLLIGAVVAFCFSTNIYAQTPGQLDPDCGDNFDGITRTQIGNGDFLVDELYSLCVAKDNTTIAVGTSRINGKKEAVIVGYNQYGFPSNYFGNRGILIVDFPSITKTTQNFFLGASPSDDGNIFVCGYAFASKDKNQTTQSLLVKVTSDGRIDESFGQDGANGRLVGKTGTIYECVKVQPDGKILACGYYNDAIMVTRYNADGTLDGSFGDGGRVITKKPADAVSSFGQDIAIQEDGKIVVGGFGFTQDSHYFGIVIRLNADGSYDSSFADNGIKAILDWGIGNDFLKSVIVQKDGKILVGGHSWDENSNPTLNEELKYSIVITRLNSDGSLDTSFGKDGLYRKNFLPEGATYMSRMVQAPVGNIYAGFSLAKKANSASGEVYDMGIIALDDMGRENQNFGENGLVRVDLGEDHAEAITLWGENKIIIGGRSFTDKGTKFTTLNYFRDIEKGAPLISSEESFIIYPNPVADVLHIDFAGSYEIQIFDALGKRVYTGENMHEINVKDLPKGTYFVKLISENKSFKSSFIKK